jgi:hypothetical protein
MEAMSR